MMFEASTSVKEHVSDWVLYARKNPMAMWLIPSFLVACIVLAPFAYSVYYSFTNYHAMHPDQVKWVGLVNWIKMFQHPNFWQALNVTIRFWLMGLALAIPLGLGAAMLLNQEFQGRKVVRALLIVPIMIPNVVAALTWNIMMQPLGGVLNFFLIKLHLPIQRWLTSTDTALNSVVIIDLWWSIAFVALVLMAALQSVSDEIYDSAKVDGANGLQRFLYITLPLLTPHLILVAIYRSIDLLKVFGIIYMATEGGPGRTTTTLHIEAYDRAFRQMLMGEGLPYALLLTAVLVIIVGFLEWLWGRSRHFVGAE
jgi:multiple sugar transport system permease protein